MPGVSFSRTRESALLMEQKLKETVELAKQATLIKYTEAQTIPVEQFVTPEMPVDKNQAQAMKLLVVRGPLRVAEVAKLMGITEALAEIALNGLVAETKAIKDFQGDNWCFILQQTVVKKDHPYKGKKPMFDPAPTYKTVTRSDGIEEMTCTWNYKEHPI